MSRYYKAEDIRHIIIQNNINNKKTLVADLIDIPTIEVSEDNEPTWEQVKEYCFKRNFAIVGREMLGEL